MEKMKNIDLEFHVFHGPDFNKKIDRCDFPDSSASKNSKILQQNIDVGNEKRLT